MVVTVLPPSTKKGRAVPRSTVDASAGEELPARARPDPTARPSVVREADTSVLPNVSSGWDVFGAVSARRRRRDTEDVQPGGLRRVPCLWDPSHGGGALSRSCSECPAGIDRCSAKMKRAFSSAEPAPDSRSPAHPRQWCGGAPSRRRNVSSPSEISQVARNVCADADDVSEPHGSGGCRRGALRHRTCLSAPPVPEHSLPGCRPRRGGAPADRRVVVAARVRSPEPRPAPKKLPRATNLPFGR